MFRNFNLAARRILPFFFKLSAFTFSCFIVKNYTTLMKPMHCFHLPSFTTSNIFAQVLPKTIRIEHKGEIIGYAYAFSERLIVTISHELLDRRTKVTECSFFVDDNEISTKFKIVGKFEHLIFLQAQKDVLPVLPGKHPELYTQVQIMQNRSYLSIYNGYYVANDSGFGVINGKGEVGSLVLNHDGIVGIVTQIGRDSDEGFLRMILWKDIKNIVKRLQSPKESNVYLGMSVVANDKRQGISVVRVAPNSPLSSYIKMGDTVTKINSSSIKNPDDLIRIIMCSEKKIAFEIQDQQRNKRLVTVEL